MSETNNFVLCRIEGCWLPYLARNIHPEVSGSLFPFKFISHDRILDRQFFLLQMDLILDSKFHRIRGELVCLARKEGVKRGHLRMRSLSLPVPGERHVGTTQVFFGHALACLPSTRPKTLVSVWKMQMCLFFSEVLQNGYSHFTSHERENSNWGRIY